MQDAFVGLDVLTIADHGDARERDVWSDVAVALSNYELFWRTLIVLLTNRIVPDVATGPEWIRVRSSIPPVYEQLAMHNYSLFYYAATARRSIEEDRKHLGSGAYPHPECTFFALHATVEHPKALQTLARNILRDLGITRRLPTSPTCTYTGKPSGGPSISTRKRNRTC